MGLPTQLLEAVECMVSYAFLDGIAQVGSQSQFLSTGVEFPKAGLVAHFLLNQCPSFTAAPQVPSLAVMKGAVSMALVLEV
jgi:hypothetical protein